MVPHRSGWRDQNFQRRLGKSRRGGSQSPSGRCSPHCAAATVSPGRRCSRLPPWLRLQELIPRSRDETCRMINLKKERRSSGVTTSNRADTWVTLGRSRGHASLLLSIAVSASCEQLKQEKRGHAQAPDFSVAEF